MAKRMLLDTTHPEETRVVVLNGNRLEEFDFETSTKKQIKGNIYLAKVTRVEPSLQACFVEYGGNRHGFLAFSEIHPDYYRIPVGDRPPRSMSERSYDDEDRHDDHHRQETAHDTHDHEHHGQDDHDHEDHDHEHHDHDGHDQHDDAHSDHGHEDLAPDHREAEATVSSSPEAFPRTEAPAEIPGMEVAQGQELDFQGAVPLKTDQGDEAPSAVQEIVTEPQTVETLDGGDDIDEQVRHRARSTRHYKIQEVLKRRQIMLVQVTKEERGNKGAALTTYMSLAGRYCVLMPNTGRGGGVSRKITNVADRRRLKDLVGDLELPDGMGVIVRTAGSERSKAEIKRDYEYLMRLWEEIRDLTLKSTAPALIYEEGNLIKRAIRDLYSRDIDDIIVDGEEGYKTAKAFMRMLMPSHAKRVQLYRDPIIPLFHRFQVEGQLDAIHSPVVQLRSGGYIVISPTEALVAIDVNSGRSTRERNIEETALKTNIEAAEEVARQLRLRDLAGLIVIDFIDMEEHRNQAAVERRIKDAMRHDRARIQLGRISPFGLLELSRQRLRPSLVEASTQPCPMCSGTGNVRSTESTSLHVLRSIEEEGIRRRSAEISVTLPTTVALYILNQKRDMLAQIETRYNFRVTIGADDSLIPPDFRLERLRAFTPEEIAALPAPVIELPPPDPEDDIDDEIDEEAEETAPSEGPAEEGSQDRQDGEHGRRRRRKRGRRGDEERDTRSPGEDAPRDETQGEETEGEDTQGEDLAATAEGETSGEEAAGTPEGEAEGDRQDDEEGGQGRRRRRRGRRGGRRRGRPEGGDAEAGEAETGPSEASDGETSETGASEPTVAAEMVEAVPAEPAAEAYGPAVEMKEALASLPAVEAETVEAPVTPRRGRKPRAEGEAAPKPRRRKRAGEAEAEAVETAEAPVAEAAPPPAPEPAPVATFPEAPPEEPAAAPPPAVAPQAVTGPSAAPRKGWWQRLTGN